MKGRRKGCRMWKWARSGDPEPKSGVGKANSYIPGIEFFGRMARETRYMNGSGRTV